MTGLTKAVDAKEKKAGLKKSRIERLLEKIIQAKPEILLDRARIVTRVYQETEGESPVFDRLNIPIILRIPIVPGYTDGPNNLKESARFCSDIKNLVRVDLLPYNPMSESKYLRLNRRYPLKGLKPPSEEEMDNIRRIFESFGLRVQIGG